MDKHLGLQSVLLTVKTGLEKCRREQGAGIGWSTFKLDNYGYSAQEEAEEEEGWRVRRY